MGTFSGKDGKILVGGAPLADITHWMLRTQAKNEAYASSSTSGHKRRVPGVKDCAGAFVFKLNPSDPLTDDLDAGSEVTLLLYLDATRHYTVPAVIDQLQLEVDIDQGTIVGGQAEFSGNGAVTKPSY